MNEDNILMKKVNAALILIFILVIFLVIFIGIDSLINYSKKPTVILEIPKAEEDNNALPPLAHSTSTESLQYNPLIHGIASTTPQFILFSFDGSKSLEMWKDTIDFADSLNNKGISLHFTYFINSIYLLAKENKDKYINPDGGVGESAIGFSENINYIDKRIEAINNAIDHDHEIASHSAGHFKGENWSIFQWQKEFSSFDNLLTNIQNNNPQIKFKNSLKLKISDIKGFRAPDLSINDNMYSALSLNNFSYDSSEVSLNGEWPFRDKKGIWHIPISTIFFPKMNKSIIAVDYSIWVHQTDAKNILKRGTREWDEALDDIVDGFIKHFEKSYNSSRNPIVIDNHFSTWNDGVYWEAIKKFASLECGKPNVRCSTYSDLIRYIEKDINKI